MTTVTCKDGESLEDALRRFKREVAKMDTLRKTRKFAILLWARSCRPRRSAWSSI